MEKSVKVEVKKSVLKTGEIELSGSKNAALPILIAACMSDKEIILENVPLELNDIKVLIEILQELGFNIICDCENERVNVKGYKTKIKSEVPAMSSEIRYSLLLMPLLLYRVGEISNLSAGGDKIGDRKHDIHVSNMVQMGAKITETEYINAQLDGEFKGSLLDMPIASTGATESAILAASVAHGKTIIHNANTRPEVIDLINFMNLIGANIKYKTRYIEVEGVHSLNGGSYRIMYDIHEGVSYIIFTAMLRGEMCIKNLELSYLKQEIKLLREIGVQIYEWNNQIYVSAKNRKLTPFSMETAPYPGINSDVQPLLAALAATIEGETIITDTRFTSRFQYVQEFQKMGIDIVNYQNCAIINGGKKLIGAEVFANDIRTGAALTFLGVVAEGVTVIYNYYQTERGYVNIVKKMHSVGIDIKKVDDRCDCTRE